MEEAKSRGEGIILIGFMGAGKTTLGSALAERWGYPFKDLDDVIEAKEGMTIPAIFAQRGEAGFRVAERKALQALGATSQKPMILAAGGGTPCFGENISLLKTLGQVIYLKLSPEILTQRLAPQKANRPLIASLDDTELLNFIQQLLAKRSPYYERADIILENPSLSDLLDSLKNP
ncbi:MAG: shikimate kinase [Bacteroidota bacterium]